MLTRVRTDRRMQVAQWPRCRGGHSTVCTGLTTSHYLMKDTGLDRIGRDGRLTTGAGGGCNVCQCLRLSGAAAACPLRPGLRGDCVEVYSARPSLTSLASLAFITTTYAHHMSAFIQRISTHLHTCPRVQTRLCRVSEL